jgi:hypothetical protein
MEKVTIVQNIAAVFTNVVAYAGLVLEQGQKVVYVLKEDMISKFRLTTANFDAHHCCNDNDLMKNFSFNHKFYVSMGKV